MPVDLRIAAIASRQEGVIAHRQLLGLGVGTEAIRHRIRVGRLQPAFPLAYGVGVPVESERGLWIAAVLSCEPALLSHASAGQFLGFLPLLPGPVHVTIPHRRALLRDGIITHRTRHVHRDERWIRGGIAITSPARTLVDIAGTMPRMRFIGAYDESQRLGIVSPPAVRAACERSGGKPGVALLRELASGRPLPASETRSPLETRFLRFCSERDLPLPAVNVPVLDYEVDCLWPDARLIVELDGGTHNHPSSVEADKERDARLAVAGFLVYRLTDRRLKRDPDRVEFEIRSLRDHRTAPG